VRRVTPAGLRSAVTAPPAGEEEIDASGLYLIPGLVNAYCHTAMTLLRGSAEDVYWGTLLGAAEMLLAGVTCVADHYFHMDRAWLAYRDSGMRADLAQ